MGPASRIGETLTPAGRQEDEREAEEEQWSHDLMGPAWKMPTLLCDYCKRRCTARHVCELCQDRCCTKDTFWCSSCSYQICRACQWDKALRVQKNTRKWLCKLCYKKICRVCTTTSIIGKCDECGCSICKKHICYCGESTCEHTSCVTCQYAGHSRFEFREKGWCCKEHPWKSFR